ncbi:unnamed protein product [Enterobius vermicularis]|uniref:LRRCT domain-containing protein n=1 Tax=Enterobius vermicularis TaxID=51028 RepID=A0A0N4VEC3_ENTVE|nr:unnamed protein product [Enterobius vermicularis]
MILATVAELLLLQVLLGNCADVEQAVHMCGKESDDTLEAGCECHDDKNLIICDDNKILPGHEKNLVELYFNFNRISKIENGTFDEMINLEVLDLSGNRLKKIEAFWFQGAKWKLKYLNLEENTLQSLPVEVFSTMPTLESLILDGNPKLFDWKNSSKPFGFGDSLTALKNLSMNSCKIKNLPDDYFAKLTSLEVLSLANNFFITLPTALHKIPSLLSLDLSKTDITEIDQDSFLYDTNLQSLFCVDCQYLEFVDDCGFCGLKNLKELDLHGCIQLYDISDKAFGYGHKDAVLPKLEYLDLQQTKMSTLSGNLFDSSNLIGLAFSSTPWNCTCDTAWMLELDLEVIKGPKCQSPQYLKDKQLLSLTSQMLCPNRLRFTKLMLSLFVVLTAVFFAIFVYYLTTNYRIRNIFYRPDMPNVGYRNLSNADEESHRNVRVTPAPA